MNSFSIALASGLAFVASFLPRACADTVVMDQIGSSGAFFTGQTGYVSQRPEAVYNSYTTAAVDDFQVGSAFTLTNVTAAILGYRGFTTYNDVTGYEVNIYSSKAAALANVNGDLYHIVLSPAQVALTAPFSGDANSALVSLPISVLLAQAGTYYVSVLTDLAYGTTTAQTAVYQSATLPGSNPGGLNGFLSNPGGSFNLPGNQAGIAGDFAYRINGTPSAATVPDNGATALLLVLGLGGLALAGRGLAAKPAAAI